MGGARIKYKQEMEPPDFEHSTILPYQFKLMSTVAGDVNSESYGTSNKQRVVHFGCQPITLTYMQATPIGVSAIVVQSNA